MSRRRRSSVERYHDRVAPRYDHSYDDAFWRWHDALTWDYLKPHVPHDLSAEIVDLGCGTGKWASRLIQAGFRVTCVDISRGMLDEARRKIESGAGAARASFVHADLSDLRALAEGRFALAVALGDPIGCADSPSRAMKQIRRILRPGGMLVATFDNKLAAMEHYLERGDAESLIRFLRTGRTHWLTDDPEERFEIATFSPSELVALAEAGGFEVIELVGKTVLPMRHYRGLLESPEARRAWAKVERSLSRDRDAMGLASHLQIVCRIRC
jgi:ubiquinone/menaquinone biosynthesis C-methylase UbiE